MDELPAIVFDVDGVLTDGKVNVTGDGMKLFKSFHSRDVRAIRELVQRGHDVWLVTADDWDGSRLFAEKVGAGWGCLKDKSEIKKTFPKGYYFIGDDAFDVRALFGAKRMFCPADADQSVKTLLDIEILKTSGGRGVAAEVLQVLYYPELLGHNQGR